MTFSSGLLDELRAAPSRADVCTRSLFLDFLRMGYHLMCASEPVLALAIDSTPSSRLRDFFVEHLEEERNHARWARDDLATADVDPHDEVLQFEAAFVAGPQLYLARFGPQAALLGYMAALECTPTSLEVIEALERQHGAALVRTMRHHAEHDPEHGAALCAVIDNRTAADQALIRVNALRTAEGLARINRLLGARHGLR